MATTGEETDAIVTHTRSAKEPKRRADYMDTKGRSSSAPQEVAMGKQQPGFTVLVDTPLSQSSSNDENEDSDDSFEPDVDDAVKSVTEAPGINQKKPSKSKTPTRELSGPKQDGEGAVNIVKKKTKRREPKLPQDIAGCHALLAKKSAKLEQKARLLITERDKIRRFRDRKSKQKIKIDELQLKLEQQDKLVAQLEEDNEKLHDERLQLISKDVFPVEPDDVIAADLKGIFSETMAFSKRWSWKGWASARQNEIVRPFQDFNRVERIASEPCILAVQNKKLAPHVILNATLNCALCDATFERPFAHLREDSTDPSNEKFEDLLDSLMNLARTGAATSDPTKVAQKLRVDILRAIHFPSGSGQRFLPEHDSYMTRLQDVHRDAIVDGCLDRCESLLCDISDGEEVIRREELITIVRAAWGLSHRLAVQYPYIDVSYLNVLGEEPFTLNHAKFLGHRGMKLKEDQDDNFGHYPQDIGIEGKTIDLVIEPLVQRTGDAKGTCYDKTKILHKAMVWVIPPSELDDPSDTITVNRHETAPSKFRNELLSPAARAGIAELPSAAEEIIAVTTLLELCKGPTTGVMQGEKIQGKKRKAPEGDASEGEVEAYVEDSGAEKRSAETTLDEPCSDQTTEVMPADSKKRKAPDSEEGEGGVGQLGEGSATGPGSAKEGTEEPPEKKPKTESAQ